MDQDKKQIEKLLSQYESCLNTSNTQGAVALYSDDGIFMPTEAPTAQGKEQLVASYAYVFKTIKLNIKFSVDELRISGDIAFARTMSRGKVTVLEGNITVPEENREFFLLEKVKGEWRIARYMFNKSKPSHS